MTPYRSSLFLVALLAATGTWAQVEPGIAVEQKERLERQRIAQTREVERARLAAAEAQCYQLFAVNDCLIAVRRERRELLADLRRQELSINDAQRRRRGAEQLLRSDEKATRTP